MRFLGVCRGVFAQGQCVLVRISEFSLRRFQVMCPQVNPARVGGTLHLALSFRKLFAMLINLKNSVASSIVSPVATQSFFCLGGICAQAACSVP